LSILTSDVQADLSEHLLVKVDQSMIFKTMTCPYRHSLVGPIASSEKALEVPRTVRLAQLHGPEHPALGV
jgi:hypothetical protein